LSCRLPPRSRRWRWRRPELASKGATTTVASELCVAGEAVDRADFSEELRGGERGAAGQLEQRGRCISDPLFELLVECGELAVQAAAAGDELAREAHLQLLLLPGEPAADALQVREAAEHP
jgi:hypothetical protein